MFEGKLEESDYPYVKDKPLKAKLRANNQMQNNAKGARKARDYSMNPRIFTFVVGGMSHHEVVGISLLQEELSAHIVPGRNEIFSSS